MYYLRHTGRGAPQGVVSDAQLLDRFIRDRDQSAFELLVWRHGAMVLGLAQRIVNDSHAAEDVFQAAFFTLAKKAANVRDGALLVGWLYRVTYRLALRAREMLAQQSQREQAADQQTLERQPAPDRGNGDQELRAVLDEEINLLPIKYRIVLLLCCLEGKSKEEAADELGLPVGTVYSRLSRAREKLGRRLARRGFALASLSLLLLLAPSEVAAALIQRTARHGVALAAGTTTIAQLSPSIAALLQTPASFSLLKYLAVFLVLLAAGGIGYQAWAGSRSQASNAAEASAPVSATPAPCKGCHP